jgi:sigma-B regulation protein RsbU (phosphoserine phosphatase)
LLEDELTSLKQDNDAVNRAINEAAQLQRQLCGPRYFRTHSYEFAAEIFPVRHLSGDFISVMQLEGDLVFAVGDIAGKGIVAGMWFTHLTGMIRRAIATHKDPAAALSAVNRDRLITGIEFPLTTLFLARLNLISGGLTYCNAGHPPALLIRDKGEVEALSEGGPVLGAFSDASFVNGSATLVPRNTLLVYSDGIVECKNESGVEFGTERLASAGGEFSESNASGVVFSVLGAVENFAQNRHREDDIAVMALRHLGSCEIDRSERYAA